MIEEWGGDEVFARTQEDAAERLMELARRGKSEAAALSPRGRRRTRGKKAGDRYGNISLKAMPATKESFYAKLRRHKGLAVSAIFGTKTPLGRWLDLGTAERMTKGPRQYRQGVNKGKWKSKKEKQRTGKVGAGRYLERALEALRPMLEKLF